MPVLTEAVHGHLVRQLVARKLRNLEFENLPGPEVRVEQPAVDPPDARLIANRQVAEHILADQFRNTGAAIDEAAGDRDAVAVVVLRACPTCP